VLAAIGLGLLLAVPAGAARRTLKRELSSTGADSNASGRAKLVLRSDSNGKFDLIGHHLDRGATFQVLVGGVNVGALKTNHGGNGRATFRTRPRAQDALLGFDPRGQRVTVRNADGQDVLGCDLPDGGAADEVPCCLSHEGHIRCDGRTAESCTAAGGTVAMAPSCLPDPCGGGPEPEGVVCCTGDSAEGALLRDESGYDGGDDDGDGEHGDGDHGDSDDGDSDSASGAHVGCTDDLDQAGCVARGGSVVQATSCHPNPCAPTPPPVNVAPCCVPDDDDTECEMYVPERCTARGGTSPGGTSCASHSCGDPGHHGRPHGHGD
jgi:hypothetical protein